MVRIFLYDHELYANVTYKWNESTGSFNFQLKTYGMKAQVHSIPDSKKQRQR